MLFLRKKSAFISYLVLGVLVLLPFLSLVHKTEAAWLTKVSDTIDDSRPSTATSHTFLMVTPSGVQASETIIITFPAGFTLTNVDYNDIDLAEDDDASCNGTWSDRTLAATATTGNWGVAVDTGNRTITFTAPSSTGTITAGRCVQIEVGDNATGGTSNDEVINPTAGVYSIEVTGTFGDTGTAMVAIVATITAEATINETLTFTVSGQTASSQCAGYSNGATGSVDTTATSIPFGTVTTETFYDGCQALSIATNAANGYTVTVQESDQLNSGVSTIPDGTCDGACSEASEAAWATATNNGFAYCMQDTGATDGAATADAGWGTNGCDAASTYFKLFAEKDVDSPDKQVIMTSTSNVNDSADIGYRLSVDGAQPAGVYQNNIIFVATPNY